MPFLYLFMFSQASKVVLTGATALKNYKRKKKQQQQSQYTKDTIALNQV